MSDLKKRLRSLVEQWDQANSMDGEMQSAVRFEVGNCLRNEVNAIVRTGQLVPLPEVEELVELMRTRYAASLSWHEVAQAIRDLANKGKDQPHD